ncbi:MULTISPECIES: MutS-related protein [Flavobacteriaceae]|uniref:MutS-related protein n=1 Tax=Flavobacteriaceae TaxID=49546 RepID=UPI001492DD7F|nr:MULTISPECIES: DNA mismatch repair protein MutS [Allomuricauda]MDC6364448.1 DNA mismatch repair protein MutS [Muricauda sp. AC10]
MQDPISFYKERLQGFSILLKKNNERLQLIGFLRLMVFVITTILTYFFFENTITTLCIVVIGVVGFVFLIRMYESKKEEYRLHKELAAINEEELEIHRGDYLNRYDGKEYEEANHFYSSDVDLFGRGSFFQYINRTGIHEGTQHLAQVLASNNILGILERQEAIKELSSKIEWRQNYTALARMIKNDVTNVSIVAWLKGYVPFVSSYFKWVVPIFGIISTILIFGSVFGHINPQAAFYWLLLGLGITAARLKQVNTLSTKTGRIRKDLQQYAKLLSQIESEEFSASILKSQRKSIESNGLLASESFKKFSQALDALDNRNNLIVAFLGNGFFLWDLLCSRRIEKWVEAYRNEVEQWLKTVAFFDAFNSLGTFAFNHPTYNFPEILASDQLRINAKSLGHPLIPNKKRINSDLQLMRDDFFIITGANMAGKSTFLRTISLYIIMANSGLPVCAERSQYNPIKLITSMRTEDSLTDNSSYFFAELSRLQFVMEQLQEDEYLVVLDEILKGTNSVDKASGSKELIKKLTSMGVSGIIATHDLSLCELSKEHKTVKNYFFETEIVNDELHFDYMLRKGICKNMNASFLLRKMDII